MIPCSFQGIFIVWEEDQGYRYKIFSDIPIGSLYVRAKTEGLRTSVIPHASAGSTNFHGKGSVTHFIIFASIVVGGHRWLVFQVPLQFGEADYIWPPGLSWKGRRS